jgi:ABC-type polysaccharide/polyol phosphate export permease
VNRLPTSEAASKYSVSRAIVEIVREISAGRELTRQLTLRDFRIRYKQAVFGLLWAVLMPGMIVLSGLVVRFAISQMSATEFQATIAASLGVKALAWGFFVGAIAMATPSLLSNSNLVTKVYFPREVLPVSAILTQSIDSAIGATVFAVILPFLGVRFSTALAWVPVLIVLLVCLALASGLILSCANAFFRDVKYLVQMLLSFGIFFSPVFYEPATLGPVGAKLLMLNPVAPILEGLRLSIVERHNLLVPLTIVSHGHTIVVWNPWYLAYTAAIALGGLLVSALVFHHAEGVYAEYV